MRITFLGSGGAFTDHRVNYHNNALVDTAAGPVLLDCGTTAVQSMRELDIPRTSVAAVLLTHLHGDHASPEQLLWERYYGASGATGGPAYGSTRIAAPPDILGPLRAALVPYVDEFSDRHAVYRRGGVDELVRAEPTRDVEIGGVRFRYFRVPHVRGGTIDKPAYGLDIDDGTTRVLWSGDTTFAPEWIRAAAADPRVATIFHECLFAPRFPGSVHTHWDELAALPAELLGRVTLMHHTEVPRGVDVSGTSGAAARHQVYDL